MDAQMAEECKAPRRFKNTKRNYKNMLRLGSVATAVAILLAVFFWPGKTEDGFVTAPGILKVYAYDMTSGGDISQMDTFELEDGIVNPQSAWCDGMNSAYGIPIKFCVEDETMANEEITFHITVNGGEFTGDIHAEKYKPADGALASLEDAYLGNDFVIENGETIFWSGRWAEVSAVLEESGGVFADVVIFANDRIVGYVVVEVLRGSFMYCAKQVKSEFFPKVDGEYQQVTEAYVQQRIAECKQSAAKQ